jgi:hypothetical protein
VTTLTHHRLSSHVLNRLIDEARVETSVLTDDHRRSLSARFRAVPHVDHRRLDAWMVERAGRSDNPFRWSPATARRVLGNAALRRCLDDPSLTRVSAVEVELEEQLLRYVTGYARPGSLASYLAVSSNAELGLVRSEAANWTTQLAEVTDVIARPWEVAASDVYYDVARARTTLRGRRDAIVTNEQNRVLIRVRLGAPGKSAGPGLRADLTIDALANARGMGASRIIGVWPEAGVLLSVEGTMADLRAGARDLVRTAVARQRPRERLAA